MHRAWSLPLLLLAAVGSAVAQPAPKSRATISDRLAREIRATLPGFEQNVTRLVTPGRLEPGPDDPGVITLPEVIVEDRRPAVRMLEDLAREAGEFSRLKRQYLASMNRTTALLNSWAFPVLSPSVDARAAASARREMLRSRIAGFETVAAAVATIDPAAADGLGRELHALKHGTHPPGWPPLRP